MAPAVLPGTCGERGARARGAQAPPCARSVQARRESTARRSPRTSGGAASGGSGSRRSWAEKASRVVAAERRLPRNRDRPVGDGDVPGLGGVTLDLVGDREAVLARPVGVDGVR